MGLPWRWHIGRLIDILFDRIYGLQAALYREKAVGWLCLDENPGRQELIAVT